MSLTSKQRAFLKSEAHTLKPIVQIGKNGLNDHIKTSVRNALDARELLKSWKKKLAVIQSLRLDVS